MKLPFESVLFSTFYLLLALNCQYFALSLFVNQKVLTRNYLISRTAFTSLNFLFKEAGVPLQTHTCRCSSMLGAYLVPKK